MSNFKRFDRTADDVVKELKVDGTPDRRRGLEYQIGENIEHAINTALGLGRPLLVSGETGCGKTELGFAIARKLGIPNVRFYSVKSESEAQGLFYEYDSLQRFHLAQSVPRDQGQAGAEDAVKRTNRRDKPVSRLAATHPLNFITYQALGLAILEANCFDKVKHLLPPNYKFPDKPVKSVVVIDEIDKAPRDFPNDLLNEIDQLWFRVPQLSNWVPSPETPREPLPAELRPVVVITSNLERQLPDAFLRRCVFHHIEHPNIEDPEGKRLQENIVLGHLKRAKLRLADEDLGKAIAFIAQARALPLDKKPGLAELLEFVRILASRENDLKGKPFNERAEACLSAIAKTTRDTAALRRLLR
jgi:MoxR-like ATPase